MVDGITDSVDMNLSKLRETLKDRGAWKAIVPGVGLEELSLKFKYFGHLM